MNFAYCLVPCCECLLCISYLGIAIFDTDLLHFLILTSIPSVEETTAASLQRIPCQNGILDLLFMTVDLRLVPRSVITVYLFGLKISIFWLRIFSVHVVSILSLIISILGVFYIENLVLYHIPLVLFFPKIWGEYNSHFYYFGFWLLLFWEFVKIGDAMTTCWEI